MRFLGIEEAELRVIAPPALSSARLHILYLLFRVLEQTKET
jgi:hypothetical protein